MAGCGEATALSADLGATRVLVWSLILVSLETLVNVVDTKCTFSGTSVPSLGVVDLECECPRNEGDFRVLIQMSIMEKVNALRLEQIPNDLNQADVKIKADERDETDNSKARMRFHVQLQNYETRWKKEGVNYTCKIKGKRDQRSKWETKFLPVVWRTATTTTVMAPTSTPTTRAGKETLPPPTPPREDVTRIAATVENTENTFSRAGLYTVIAISCVLLIVIIAVIIYYVRVREQRRQERLALAEDLELEDGHHLTANPMLTHKPEGNGRKAPHHQIPTDSRGQRQEVPLLENTGQGQRRRSVTSDDEDDLNRRKMRFFNDTPRRSRPREVIPFIPATDQSRCLDVLDLEEPMYRRSSKHHRFFFPHNYYDDTFEEECDPFYHQQKYTAPRYPPRSWSEHSLYRHPQYALRGQGSPSRNYFLLRPSRNPNQPHVAFPARGYEDNQLRNSHFQLPTDLTQFSEHRRAQHPPVGFQQGQQPTEATPLTVRVSEDSDEVYQDDCHGSDYRTRGLCPGYEAGSPTGTQARADTIPQSLAEGHVRQVVQAEVEVAPRPHGESPVTRVGQRPTNQQEGPYERDNMPVRRYIYAPSPSRPHKYHTTSMPRHRSTERATRSGRPIYHSGPHPQFYYVSDGEMGSSPSLQFAVEQDDPQPRTRRKPRGKRRSRSAGNLEDDVVIGPRQYPYYEHGNRMPPHIPAPKGLQEMSQLPYAAGSEPRRQMNLLSRDNISPTRCQTDPLNVPVAHGQPAREGTAPRRHDTTHRKTPVAEALTQVSRPRPQQDEVRPRPRGGRIKGAAQVSDSSPNTTPPQDRRSLSSSSDNDNIRPHSSKNLRQESATDGENHVRNIKTDNETQRKRPVSFKARNTTHPPVACAADVTERQNGSGPSAAHGGLQKRDSARSASHAPTRREGSRRERSEAERPESELRPEQLGVVTHAVSSLERGDDSHCSDYTEHGHSTTAKILHPRLG